MEKAMSFSSDDNEGRKYWHDRGWIHGSRYSPIDYQAHGVSLEHLHNAGFTIDDLLVSPGVTLADCTAAGIGLQNFLTAGFVLRDFSQHGYTLETFKEQGYPPQAIVECGYGPGDFEAAGFTLKDLEKLGASGSIFLGHASISEIKDAGFVDFVKERVLAKPCPFPCTTETPRGFVEGRDFELDVEDVQDEVQVELVEQDVYRSVSPLWLPLCFAFGWLTAVLTR